MFIPGLGKIVLGLVIFGFDLCSLWNVAMHLRKRYLLYVSVVTLHLLRIMRDCYKQLKSNEVSQTLVLEFHSAPFTNIEVYSCCLRRLSCHIQVFEKSLLWTFSTIEEVKIFFSLICRLDLLLFVTCYYFIYILCIKDIC